MGAAFGLKFWGTRGLISSPRNNTAIFGGNTPCIQIIHKDHLILVDTGFGVTNLGEVLLDKILKEKAEINVHIFYTHFHWDHIQGLPFFHPIYFPSTTLNLYSPIPKESAIQNLDVLFDGSYSPFAGIKSMPSTINFRTIDKVHDIDGLKIEYAKVDHFSDPQNLSEQSTFAFKFTEPGGESIAIATDHEARESMINNRLIDFAKDVDILVHDAQYTDEEYMSRVGWGHSTMFQALDNSLRCEARRTLLTHHDPARSDSHLQEIYRNLNKNPRYAGLNFEFAREEVLYAVDSKAEDLSKKKIS